MFKRFLAYILCLSLVALPFPSAWAGGEEDDTVAAVPVASGVIAAGAAKFSLVDGAAFVDWGEADVITTKLGNLLRIKSVTSGQVLQGFIKAAGTSETLDTEILADGTFAASGWTAFDGWSDTGVATNAPLEALLTQDTANAGIVGALYKSVYTVSSYTDGSVMFIHGVQTFTERNTAATFTEYTTKTSNDGTYANFFTKTAGTDLTIANASYKQVTTPSATGVTIVSAKGGATYNWAAKPTTLSSFLNDTAGYTYEILKVLSAPVVATGSITAGNALMDTTTANAFAAPVGVDLSPYQDGKHILALYNTTGGYAALAWISATAPGGETLDANVFASFNFTSGWTTTTVATIVDADTYSTTGTGSVLKAGSFTVGGLYKSSLTGSTSDTAVTLRDSNTNTVMATMGAGDSYVNAPFTGVAVRNNSAGTTDISTLVSQRVTDCAVTSALLLSTKGGSRGYLYKHASFGPDGAMAYKVLYVGD